MKKKVGFILLAVVFAAAVLSTASGLAQAADVIKLTIAGFTPPGAGAIPSVTLVLLCQIEKAQNSASCIAVQNWV